MTATAAGLAYERHGPAHAEHVVLALHGVGHHRAAWREVADRLTGSIALVALDLPGHGDSAPLDATTWDVDRLVDAVHAAVVDLGLDRPAVVGNSLGGAVALELAGRGPTGGVGAVVALSPTGYWSGAEVRYAVALLRVSQWLARHTTAAVVAAQRFRLGRLLSLAPYSARPTHVTPATAADTVRAFAGATGLRAIVARSAAYRGPRSTTTDVTIAWGGADRLLIGRQRARSFAAFPNARHVVLDGCGHVPMFDDPAAVARLIERSVTAA